MNIEETAKRIENIRIRLYKTALVYLGNETLALDVVILRYFAGYTLVETAEALKIPQGTAATRQRKALKLQRLELGEEVSV